MKLAPLGALALACSLAACAVDPTTGQYEIAGRDIGITPAQAAVATADVKAFIAALPSVCAKAAVGQAILAADLAVIQANSKLPAKTVANIANATSKIVTVCAQVAATMPAPQ
jgi:hypothetical protein